MGEDEVSSKLRSWVEQVIGHVPVSFGAPAREAAQPGIFLHFLGLLPNLALRGDPNRRDIFRRYLVCEGDPSQHHVEQLMFRAMEAAPWQVETEPLQPDFWIALGIPMTPAFVLRVPVTKIRTRPQAPPAKSVELKTSTVSALTGIVQGTDGLALSGCTVELKERGMSAITGFDGTFAFPSMVRTIGHRFRLGWQGREQFVDVAPGEGFASPVVVTLDNGGN